MTRLEKPPKWTACRIAAPFTWRPRGLSKWVISRVISTLNGVPLVITLLITDLLSPLGLQLGLPDPACQIAFKVTRDDAESFFTEAVASSKRSVASRSWFYRVGPHYAAMRPGKEGNDTCMCIILPMHL